MVDSASRIEIHIHTASDAAIAAKLDNLTQLVKAVLKLEVTMSGELDALTAEVQRNTEVDESAKALIQGILAKLDAAIAAGDPVKIKALADSLRTSTDALAAAVAQNTPAATP